MRVVLTARERETLERNVRRGTTSQQMVLRSRIVLACASGRSHSEIAAELGVALHTVAKWRNRFAAGRVDGLLDRPRSGAPRRIGDEIVSEVIVRTLEPPPGDGKTWSTRTLAEAVGVSRESVGRIWRQFGLSSNGAEGTLLSRVPECVAEVQDVSGLYVDSRCALLALSIREGSPSAPTDRSAPPTDAPTLPNPRPAPSAVCLLGGILGRGDGPVAPEGPSRFLHQLDRRGDSTRPMRLILDGPVHRESPAFRRWLAGRPHCEVRLVPTLAVWLRQVERILDLLAERVVTRGERGSVLELEAAIRQRVGQAAPEASFCWIRGATTDRSNGRREVPARRPDGA